MPAPKSVVIVTAIATSAPTIRCREQAAMQQRRDGEPGGGAEAERDPDQRGENQSGQHRVRDRLRRVALPVENDPDPERAADRAQDDQLDQRALADAPG